MDAELLKRLEALDVTLMDPLGGQTSAWDRRALLALHAVVAQRASRFAYLEIGSYMGGSLQALMCDPRCHVVLSVDPRPPAPPDVRGTSYYADNTTERMRALLSVLPGVDMDKLITFEQDASELALADLGALAPALCFVDGEHTDSAVLADGRFCVEAVRGSGVVAFHDSDLVTAGLMELLSELWPEITAVAGFGGSVLAIEFGGAGVLGDPLVQRAGGSRWHSAVWRLASRPPSARPLLAAWQLMPRLDRAAVRVRAQIRRPRR